MIHSPRRWTTSPALLPVVGGFRMPAGFDADGDEDRPLPDRHRCTSASTSGLVSSTAATATRSRMWRSPSTSSGSWTRTVAETSTRLRSRGRRRRARRAARLKPPLRRLRLVLAVGLKRVEELREGWVLANVGMRILPRLSGGAAAGEVAAGSRSRHRLARRCPDNEAGRRVAAAFIWPSESDPSGRRGWVNAVCTGNLAGALGVPSGGGGASAAVLLSSPVFALRSFLFFLPEPLEEPGQREDPQRHAAAGAALRFGQAPSSVRQRRSQTSQIQTGTVVFTRRPRCRGLAVPNSDTGRPGAVEPYEDKCRAGATVHDGRAQEVLARWPVTWRRAPVAASCHRKKAAGQPRPADVGGTRPRA